MTIEQFRSSDEKRSALKNLLSNPVLQEAIGCLMRSSIPTTIPVCPQGVDYSTFIAHKYRELQGRVAVLRDLQEMIHPNPEPTSYARPDPLDELRSWVESSNPYDLFTETTNS